jgi:hypothetical protein
MTARSGSAADAACAARHGASPGLGRVDFRLGLDDDGEVWSRLRFGVHIENGSNGFR